MLDVVYAISSWQIQVAMFFFCFNATNADSQTKLKVLIRLQLK